MIPRFLRELPCHGLWHIALCVVQLITVAETSNDIQADLQQ